REDAPGTAPGGHGLDARLERGGARRVVPAEAHPGQAEAVHVDVVPLLKEVEDRGDGHLVVGAAVELLEAERGTAPGGVDHDDVHAAGGELGPAEEVQLLGPRVGAAEEE